MRHVAASAACRLPFRHGLATMDHDQLPSGTWLARSAGRHGSMAGVKGNVQNGMRLFSRAVRPLALRTAGKESSGTAVIKHVGRKSGKAYDTPVTPVRHGDVFFIALPYGPRTDWLRNVLAAGAATLVVRGQVYRVGQPEVMPVADAAQYFPAGARRMQQRFGVDSVLRLQLLA